MKSPNLPPYDGSDVVQATDEESGSNTPRALSFTLPTSTSTSTASLEPSQEKPSIAAGTALRKLVVVDWDESDTPTPRGSVCVPLALSASASASASIPEEEGFKGSILGSGLGLALEFDDSFVDRERVRGCSNPFPSPPPSPPLVSPTGEPGERRIVVGYRVKGVFGGGGEDLVSSPTSTVVDDDDDDDDASSSSSATIFATPNEDEDEDGVKGAILGARSPLSSGQLTKQKSSTSCSRPSHPHPKGRSPSPEPEPQLIFDSTLNRYILPPTLSHHVSHLRWHLSRAYERRKVDEQLREARGRVMGELRAFRGRWGGRHHRNREKEKEKERDARDTVKRIESVRDGVRGILGAEFGSVPVRGPSCSVDESKEEGPGNMRKAFKVIQDPISPSRFLSILQSHDRETVEEVDVKLRLWEGWEWDAEVEWGLEFWKCGTTTTKTANAAATTPPIYLPNLRKLKITAVGGVPLRPIFERIKLSSSPSLEEVCIGITTPNISSATPRQSTRQAQKAVQRTLEGDPWTALLDRNDNETPVSVELCIPPKVQFDEEMWVEDTKRGGFEGRVVLRT
ncbi:hypothetical protein MD484_g2221, partial [Candolleomyces efflorescens]